MYRSQFYCNLTTIGVSQDLEMIVYIEWYWVVLKIFFTRASLSLIYNSQSRLTKSLFKTPLLGRGHCSVALLTKVDDTPGHPGAILQLLAYIERFFAVFSSIIIKNPLVSRKQLKMHLYSSAHSFTLIYSYRIRCVCVTDFFNPYGC